MSDTTVRTPLLDSIVARGNRGHRDEERSRKNLITCADGFTLSVIAGGGVYCTPRPDLCWRNRCPSGPDHILSNVRCDYPGPYVAVEVGFPSERPEPWRCTDWHDGYDSHADHGKCDGWSIFAEDEGAPTETVYGYVPVDMVRALIEAHGGEA